MVTRADGDKQDEHVTATETKNTEGDHIDKPVTQEETKDTDGEKGTELVSHSDG